MLKKLLVVIFILSTWVGPVSAEESQAIVPEWTYKWLLNGKWWTQLSSDSITHRYWYPVSFFDGYLRINLESNISQSFSSKPCYLDLKSINTCRTNDHFFQDFQNLKHQYPSTTLYSIAQNPPFIFATNQELKISPLFAYQDEIAASNRGVYLSAYYYLFDDEAKTSALSFLIDLIPDKYGSINTIFNWDLLFYVSETERIYLNYHFQKRHSLAILMLSYLSLF